MAQQHRLCASAPSNRMVVTSSARRALTGANALALLTLATLSHGLACTSAKDPASSGAGGRIGAEPADVVDASTAGTTGKETDAGLQNVGGAPHTTTGDARGGAAGTGSVGGATATAGAAGAGGESPFVECREPKEVSSAAEVVAAIAALGSSWSITPVYLRKVDAITRDLVAAVDITVQAADITPPSNYCAMFGGDAGACGAKFLGPTDSILTGSDTLQLTAGSAIRLRPYILDLHPVGGYIALVALMPPCSKPCAEGEQRCPSDEVCYTTGEFYCLRCGKQAAEICACQLPKVHDFVVADAPAERCDYHTSADTLAVGTCVNGTCRW